MRLSYTEKTFIISKKAMTYDQYRQLRTYSWYDGIYLAVLWTTSFACLIGISAYPPLSLACNLITIMTPFFVAYRLRKYREEGLGGRITFRRALLYCLRVFLNAAILFSLMQWAYMQFLDNGHLAGMFHEMMQRPESSSVLEAYGMNTQDMVSAVNDITPTQFALTYFVINTLTGIILSLFIAAVMKKDIKHSKQ